MVEHTRTLGFWVAFALGLGTMIAAGIFPLSGTAVAEIGSSAVIAYRATEAGVPVIVYASATSVSGRVEDFLFPVYRYYKQLRAGRRPIGRSETREAPADR